ncbi:MAG TPA: hypothetical protein ENL34_14015 [Chloroflexi bacterium]|nr:hypothetical protein [Chloroflexota bacterium]
MTVLSEAAQVVKEESHPQAAYPVDLNSASQELLEALPGIGPKLATRIITYRQAHGPFASVDDITRVSGIGPVLLQRLRPRLTVTHFTGPQEEASVRATQPKGRKMTENVDVEDIVEAEVLAKETDMAMQPDEGGPLPSPIVEEGQPGEGVEEEAITPPSEPEVVETEEPAEAEEEAITPPPEPEAVETEEPAEAEEEAAPEAPVEPTRPYKRGAWIWPAVIGALAGAILGAVLALLIFAAINGAVDIRNSAAILSVEGEVSALEVKLNAVQSDVGTLQGDVGGLRERVEVLSGLTPRMDAVEQTVTRLEKSTTDLQDRVDTLDTTVSQLEANVEQISTTLEAVQDQTQKAMDFFDGLRSLLGRIFGSATPEPESRTLHPWTVAEVAA